MDPKKKHVKWDDANRITICWSFRMGHLTWQMQQKRRNCWFVWFVLLYNLYGWVFAYFQLSIVWSDKLSRRFETTARPRNWPQPYRSTPTFHVQPINCFFPNPHRLRLPWRDYDHVINAESSITSLLLLTLASIGSRRWYCELAMKQAHDGSEGCKGYQSLPDCWVSKEHLSFSSMYTNLTLPGSRRWVTGDRSSLPSERTIGQKTL